MRRAQIEALMDAHRGRVQTVASLYVLRQASLDDDDQSFLRDHVAALELADLLRWLGRSADAGSRGAIVRALAQAAATAPERFRFEVLGTRKSLLNEHEWGEIAERTRGSIEPALGAEIWARAGGSPLFRALCRAVAWAPGRPLDAAFFACERAEGESLDARVTRAFEPRGLLHRALIGWLASQLTTRTAWEQAGAEVIGALVRHDALPELNDLLAMAWSQARRDDDDDAEPPDGFRQAVHCAFALALHEIVGEALARGDRPRALLQASALACLDPPPRFRRQLHGPGRAAAGDDEIGQILDVVRSFTRHGGGRDATLSDAIAAVHALASLEGPGPEVAGA